MPLRLLFPFLIFTPPVFIKIRAGKRFSQRPAVQYFLSLISYILLFHCMTALFSVTNTPVRFARLSAFVFPFFVSFLFVVLSSVKKQPISWKKRMRKALILSFFSVILSFYTPGYSDQGDSYVLLNQAEQIARSGFMTHKPPFLDVPDPRYKSAFFPVFLALFPQTQRPELLYNSFCSCMTVCAAFSMYMLLASLFRGRTAVITLLFFMILIIAGPGELNEAQIMYLPKMFIPYVFYPMAWFMIINNALFLFPVIFIICAYNHLFYAGMLLAQIMLFLFLSRQGARKSMVIIGQCLIILLCFYLTHGIDHSLMKNTFFSDWQSSNYLDKFLCYDSFTVVNPLLFMKKCGIYLQSFMLCIAAYAGTYFMRLENRKMFLLMLSSLLCMILLGLNPLVTGSAMKFITPYKTVLLFQVFPFAAGWGALIARIPGRNLRLFMRSAFFLVFAAVLITAHRQGHNPQIPEIERKLTLDRRAFVLSDSSTSLYLAAFTGCRIFNVPRNFASPYYDDAYHVQAFRKFVKNPVKENLPEGINYLVFLAGFHLPEEFFESLITEGNYTLYRIRTGI